MNLEEWKELNHRNQSSIFEYALGAANNIIFAVSAGALGISIAFLGQTTPVMPGFLYVAWAFLVTSIAGNFIAQYTTFKIADAKMNIIYTYTKIPVGDQLEEDAVKTLPKKWFTTTREAVQRINLIMLVCLPAGVIFLIVFVAVNMYDRTHEKSIPQQPGIEERVRSLEEKVQAMETPIATSSSVSEVTSAASSTASSSQSSSALPQTAR